ncbi:histidine phosphatase superfamily [Hysterangium stoloniferum]|nr:histidine phosphatase superfamily [Hysterangium stoloniferum]
MTFGLDLSYVQQGTCNVPEKGEVEVSPDGLGTQSNSEDKDTMYKYAVFSFIRHAQSESNVDSCVDSGLGDELTTRGHDQARRLGQNWANIRTDSIYSSDMARAKTTAQAIVDVHSSTLELKTLSLLREQGHGPEVEKCMRRSDYSKARQLRTGGYAPSSQEGRLHRPPGGESATDVVERGVLVLQYLIHRYGRYLPSPPTELLEDRPIQSANPFPDDVPHIVVVSHNLFLSELYEALLSWNAEQHCYSEIEYGNTHW